MLHACIRAARRRGATPWSSVPCRGTPTATGRSSGCACTRRTAARLGEDLLFRGQDDAILRKDAYRRACVADGLDGILNLGERARTTQSARGGRRELGGAPAVRATACVPGTGAPQARRWLSSHHSGEPSCDASRAPAPRRCVRCLQSHPCAPQLLPRVGSRHKDDTQEQEQGVPTVIKVHQRTNNATSSERRRISALPRAL